MHGHSIRLTCATALAFAMASIPAVLDAQRSAAVRGQAGGATLARTPSARLQGVVTDASGRAVAGVRLTIRGEALREPRTRVTDAQGRFAFESLPAGRFELTCEAAGFVTWRQRLQITSGQAASLDIAMRRSNAGPDVRPRPPAPSARGGASGAEPPSPVIIPRINGAPGDGGGTARADGPPGTQPPSAPGPPSATQPQHELLAEIDEYLARMDVGQLAFNAPETMRLGETTQIRLVLSPTMSIEQIKEQLRELPGILQGAEIKIAPEMEAVLTGQHFSITAITPAAQLVSRELPTEWRWEVSPTTAGAHRLHLALNAIILDGPRMLRTFDRTIEVDVSIGQQISGFVGEHWQWLWATAIVPIAGWLWSRRAARRKVSE